MNIRKWWRQWTRGHSTDGHWHRGSFTDCQVPACIARRVDQLALRREHRHRRRA